jgi:hypothetical protein
MGGTHQIINEGTPEESHRWRRQLPSGGFIGMGVGGMCWAEASLPKFVSESSENIEALDLEAAIAAVTKLHSEAIEFVTPDTSRGGHDVGAAKIVRLDLVRDFDDVHSMTQLLDGLAGVQQPARCKVKRHADPERARAQTLTVGPLAWHCTLYDKAAETKGRAPDGRLRFEARLHQEQLRSEGAKRHGGHVNVVEDLDETKLRSLRKWMFNRVGFDREVVAVGRVQQLVFADVDPVTKVDRNGMTKAQQRTLWAYLTAGQRGVDIGMSRHTKLKYRRLSEQLGITMSPEQLIDESRFTVALDFDRGTEILRAA